MVNSLELHHHGHSIPGNYPRGLISTPVIANVHRGMANSRSCRGVLHLYEYLTSVEDCRGQQVQPDKPGNVNVVLERRALDHHLCDTTDNRSPSDPGVPQVSAISHLDA